MSGMSARRGYPDRRGMGAQSDSITATFVASEEHRAEQKTRAQALLRAGFLPEEVVAMLSVPLEQVQGWVLDDAAGGL